MTFLASVLLNDYLQKLLKTRFQQIFGTLNNVESIASKKGWRIGYFSEIANVTSGKRPPNKFEIANSENNIPIIGASSIMGYTSQTLYGGDQKIIVIGRVGTHGVINCLSEPCWPSDNTLVITSAAYEYTAQVLKQIDYSAINRGSTQPLITQSDIKNQKVVIPNASVLDNFEIWAETIRDSINKTNKENIVLASLRDSLLPKLLNGEI